MSWRAVYRLQLGPELDFRRARELVPYLRELGVSHLYLSPVLQARPGSTHGYDVVDPTRVSDDLGGEAEFRELCAAGLGVLLDVVPNHMAVAEENRYWADRDLRARFFDWDPATDWHRRFFTIDELAGVRQEDEGVFEETHRKTLQFVAEGLVDGLRIDHPDGLANPREYLDRLRDHGVEHVWVEKIVQQDERVRDDWPVEGTTGYEFANDVTALFVDPAGEEPLTELYRELTGERRSFAEVAHEAKLEQARTDFRPEFERLRTLFDHPQLEEAAASLHVYRTYIEPGRVAPEDLEALAGVPEEIRRRLLVGGEFTVGFQQTTGAVMAKGVEDTSYRWLRLTALNEVAGNPDYFSMPVEVFHEANLGRGRRFPLHLMATQTHDTKRSGDVRARIGALAAMPEWAAHARAWQYLEDPNENYLLLQTLVGAWPIGQERLQAYMRKALREAGTNTSWLRPNEAHEQAVQAGIARFYEEPPAAFEPFAARVAEAGRRVSLAQTLLKLTSPGVPDIYQGDELESLNLVDPDNRRPVDWDERRRALADPPPKLRLIRAALALRARRPEAFAGPYTPVDAGPDVCAFLRGERKVLVAAALRPGAEAHDVDVSGRWRNVFDGSTVKSRRLRDLGGGRPFALLERA